MLERMDQGPPVGRRGGFPVLLSAKVAPGNSNYQTQLQGAFLDLNVTSDRHTPQPCAWGGLGKEKGSA